MVFAGEPWDNLKSILDDVSIWCRNLEHTISSSKTKTLAVMPSDLYPKIVPINLFPDDDPAEVVSNLQYLGRIV